MKRKVLIFLMCIFCLVGCFDIEKQKNEKPKEKIKEEKKEEAYQYHYSKLNKEDKKNYKALYEAIESAKKNVVFKTMKEDKVTKLIGFVLSDHPELFWSEGEYRFMQLKTGKAMQVELIYNDLKKDRKKTQKQLEKIRDEVIASIPAENDYEKIKGVYNYAAQNFEYVEGSTHNQNIVSSLVNKKSVCAGYAKAAQYILLGMGIDTSYISGHTVDEPDLEEGHAWNMVKLNGDYYYFDSTWGDVVEYLPHTCYGYFLMSDVDMLKTYIPTHNYEPTLNPNNAWFIHNGNYMDVWDSQMISNLWIDAINNGRNYIEIKCSPEAYANVKWRLENSQDIYTITDALGMNIQKYQYLENTEQCVFDIFY